MLRSGLVVIPVTALLCAATPILNSLTGPELDGYSILNTVAPVLFILWAATLLARYRKDCDTATLYRNSVTLAVVAVGTGALPFFQSVSETIRFPLTIANEGFVYKSAWLLAHNQAIYHSFDNPIGGIDALYPPVFFGLLAALIKVFPPGIYLLRCLTIAASVGAAVFSWRIVYRITGTWWASLAACLLPLCGPSSLFLLTGRADSLAWLFTIAALAVILDGDGRTDQLTIAAALCVLAAMTRQHFVVFPVAISIDLLIRRKWKAVAVFLAVFALPLACLTALLSSITAGRYWELVFGMVSRANYSWSSFLQSGHASISIYGILALLPFSWLWNHRNEPAYRLLAIYMALSLLSIGSAAKDGSSYNYLIEPLALFGICWGIALQSMLQSHSRAAAAILLLGACSLSYGMRGETRSLSSRPATEVSADAALVRLVKRLPGTTVTEDPYQAILYGQPNSHVEGYIETLIDPGRWPRRLARGDINLILPKAGGLHFEPEIKRIIQSRYRALRKDELSLDELPSYESYCIAVPCEQGCGIPESDSPEYHPVSPYRRYLTSILRTARLESLIN